MSQRNDSQKKLCHRECCGQHPQVMHLHLCNTVVILIPPHLTKMLSSGTQSPKDCDHIFFKVEKTKKLEDDLSIQSHFPSSHQFRNQISKETRHEVFTEFGL
jgi:hypothetical protein